jgi:hypothetical protein
MLGAEWVSSGILVQQAIALELVVEGGLWEVEELRCGATTAAGFFECR